MLKQKLIDRKRSKHNFLGVSGMIIERYLLDFAVFICGAVVMIFELVGSRILAPYFGASIYIWTSLIGVILGSLSFGYYLGGKIADRKPNLSSLSFIIFLSSFFIGLTIFIKDPLLHFFLTNFPDIKKGSFFVSLILFFPPSVLLGIVSPYAAKLRLEKLENSGSTVGNLYAISTAGSIFGTFLSGFYLIPYFGINKLLVILSMTLIIVSATLSVKKFIEIKLSVFVVLTFGWFTLVRQNSAFLEKGFIDVDTAYNRIWIYDYHDELTKKTIRKFLISGESNSRMFLFDDDLVSEYAKYFHLAKHFNPEFKRTLIIGGAGYSYPKDFLLKYPEATIDVVEIDPMVTELAKKYFKLKENPRLTIYHEDGRAYLNKTRKKYDVIFGDAFNSHYSLPYQLTTKEAVQKYFEALNNDGIVIQNVISSMEGKRGRFLRAEYFTYKSVFPQVYLFPVRDPKNGGELQNVILVALKSEKGPTFDDVDPIIDGYLQHLWKKEIETDMPVLTDDYAPVDYYMRAI